MEKEIKQVRRSEVAKSLERLFNLIDNGNINQAQQKLYKLKTTTNFFNRLPFDGDFLIKYLEEKSRILNIQKNKNNPARESLVSGILCLYFDDHETALLNFKAGEYISEEPIFLFYEGLTYYKLNNIAAAETCFLKYKNSGTVKLEETLNFLIQIYEYKISTFEESTYYGDLNAIHTYDDKIKDCKQEIITIKQIKSGQIVANRKNNNATIEYEDEIEIKELLSKGKVNDVTSDFDSYDTNKKINVLALLYIYGFDKTAETLLKHNKDVLKEEDPKKYNKLLQNKTLYLAKSKRGN